MGLPLSLYLTRGWPDKQLEQIRELLDQKKGGSTLRFPCG